MYVAGCSSCLLLVDLDGQATSLLQKKCDKM